MMSSLAAKERRMSRVSVIFLVAAFLTFGCGVILFFYFHVGQGPFRTSALSLARLTWLNVHRLSGLIVFVALGFHVVLNWKPFQTRLRRGFLRKNGLKDLGELILYVTFWTSAITGMCVWLFVSGSTPLAGPVTLGRLPHIRHHVVDVHNITGLVALLLAANHVVRRWRRMVRGFVHI